MLGVGVSAIGDVRGAFAQNTKKLSRYYAALDTGRFPIERGYVLDRDDEIRRAVIAEIMCNFRLEPGVIEDRFGIEFARYFETELRELVAKDGPVDHGFLRVEPRRLEVVGHGRLFVRNIAMVFDAHLRQRKAERQIFSRTV
jgi:oxygen-independent coproporphyrinogen-3 oxidase